jgi:hypothetical protein
MHPLVTLCPPPNLKNNHQLWTEIDVGFCKLASETEIYNRSVMYLKVILIVFNYIIHQNNYIIYVSNIRTRVAVLYVS